MLLKELLRNDDGTQKMIDDCINVVQQSEHLVLFGAGVGGGSTL